MVDSLSQYLYDILFIKKKVPTAIEYTSEIVVTIMVKEILEEYQENK